MTTGQYSLRYRLKWFSWFAYQPKATILFILREVSLRQQRVICDPSWSWFNKSHVVIISSLLVLVKTTKWSSEDQGAEKRHVLVVVVCKGSRTGHDSCLTYVLFANGARTSGRLTRPSDLFKQDLIDNLCCPTCFAHFYYFASSFVEFLGNGRSIYLLQDRDMAECPLLSACLRKCVKITNLRNGILSKESSKWSKRL